jgi:predicted outer membrane repeat protein
VKIVSSVIEGNYAETDGGGLACSDSQFYIQETVLRNNSGIEKVGNNFKVKFLMPRMAIYFVLHILFLLIVNLLVILFILRYAENKEKLAAFEAICRQLVS